MICGKVKILTREELVADGMELVLTDGTVLDALARENKTLWQKIKDRIFEIIEKIKKAYGDLSKTSRTAQILSETMDSLDEIEQLFYEGVTEAGERTRTAGVETKPSMENRIVYSETAPEVIDIQPDEELTRRIEGSNGRKYDAIREYLIEKFYGQTFTMSDGRTAIMDKRDAKELSHKANSKRTAQLGNLRKIVEKATYNHTAENVDHPKFVDFHYYAASVRYNGEVIDLWINVGFAKSDKQNHIYAITNREETPTNYGVSRPVGNAIQNVSSEDSITQPDGSVNTSTENSSENSSDTAYLAAVERGDMETAQKMVDEGLEVAVQIMRATIKERPEIRGVLYSYSDQITLTRSTASSAVRSASTVAGTLPVTSKMV